MLVVKVTGYEVLFEATVADATTAAAAVTAIGANNFAKVTGWIDVTRYWGAGEGGTVRDGTDSLGNVTTFAFDNYPADSTQILNVLPVRYADVNGKNREWSYIKFTCSTDDIQSMVDMTL